MVAVCVLLDFQLSAGAVTGFPAVSMTVAVKDRELF